MNSYINDAATIISGKTLLVTRKFVSLLQLVPIFLHSVLVYVKQCSQITKTDALIGIMTIYKVGKFKFSNRTRHKTPLD